MKTDETALDLGGMSYLATIELNMAVPGTEDDAKPKLTGWILTLAGPAHSKSVEVSERQARRANSAANERDRARVNGKKWKGDEREPDEIRRETVKDITDRVLGWNKAVDFQDGKGPREFSSDACLELFLDRAKYPFLDQLIKKLSNDRNFLTASATN